jgi:FKBP-type peptidyl-prolyl cis-trans isomerase
MERHSIRPDKRGQGNGTERKFPETVFRFDTSGINQHTVARDERKIKIKSMRTRLFIPFVLFVSTLLWSCEKENPIEKQEERIETYIKAKMSKNPALQLAQDGNVYYLYTPGDTAVKISAGDSISFYYAGTLVTDTLRYFDTNYPTLADALGLDMASEKFEPVKVVAGNNKLLPGLSRGLNMAHLDDVGEIIFNSDMGYGETGNGIIPPLSPLLFKVFIVRIKKN